MGLEQVSEVKTSETCPLPEHPVLREASISSISSSRSDDGWCVPQISPW